MKKTIIIALACSLSAFSFAQKKEFKTVEKALKNDNYALAKGGIVKLEQMLSSMDDKSKSKYYFLKTQALFANGKGNFGDVNKAMQSIKKVGNAHKADATKFKNIMYNDFLTKANKALGKENHKAASFHFERAYKMRNQDTTFLYNAAVTSVMVKDYDRALKLYEKLRDVGYTGISKEYFSTDKNSGKEVVTDKVTRDLYIKAGSHIKPGERLSASKKPEIIKNIALIYISNGDDQKALAAIKDARKANPENVDLIISEANIYLKSKDMAKYGELIEQVLAKQPNNAVLHYNVGVVNMNEGNIEASKKSFERVLELDPTYSDAALNLSNGYIEEANAIIAEMGKLGLSKADEAKYQKMKIEKNQLFNTGAKVLTDFISKNPNPTSGILLQLKNIYGALGETQKAKEISAKLDAMEAK
ncbi:hypothetical protein [uncultured Algibacter sp.]|uniref:tetratricopeptide repeat protein n=1 Tax=uncultured Algibacter sp. TaxID=298659 RepID=UPI0032164958